MIADTALLEHLAACELTYQLMLEENRLLKGTGTVPGDDFLARKRSALAQLDAALAMIRVISAWELKGPQRATVVKTQQIVLKALQRSPAPRRAENPADPGADSEDVWEARAGGGVGKKFAC
jgi:hypothetical protein